MTQTEKELLLRDLCARLPYGVKIVIQDTFKYSTVLHEYHVLEVSNFSDIFCFNYKKFDKSMKKAMRERPNDIVIKPYLFPMSSMTDEQLFEVQEILGKNKIKIEDGFLSIVDSDRNTISYLEILTLLEWFYKNHFDIYGLIPMGLAIDATGLNIY